MKKIIISLAIIFTTIISLAQIPDGRYSIRLATNGKLLNGEYNWASGYSGRVLLGKNISKNQLNYVQLWDIKTIAATGQSARGSYITTAHNEGKFMYLDAEQICMGENDCTVRLFEKRDNQFQYWNIYRISGNKYFIQLSKNRNKVIDADGACLDTDGCRIHLWDKRADGFKTQTWIIEPMNYPDLIITELNVSQPQKIGTGELMRTINYTIKNIGAAGAKVEDIYMQGFLVKNHWGDMKGSKPACGAVATTSTTFTLYPNQSMTGSFNCSLPMAPGELYMLNVNYKEKVVEFGPLNNDKYFTIN